jgi:hypothetical protein
MRYEPYVPGIVSLQPTEKSSMAWKACNRRDRVRSVRGVRGVANAPCRSAPIPRPERAGSNPSRRCSRAPGMHGGHELLLAVIMAIAMTATLFLYAR